MLVYHIHCNQPMLYLSGSWISHESEIFFLNGRILNVGSKTTTVSITAVLMCVYTYAHIIMYILTYAHTHARMPEYICVCIHGSA